MPDELTSIFIGAAMGDGGEFDQPFRDPLWAGFLS